MQNNGDRESRRHTNTYNKSINKKIEGFSLKGKYYKIHEN